MGVVSEKRNGLVYGIGNGELETVIFWIWVGDSYIYNVSMCKFKKNRIIIDTLIKIYKIRLDLDKIIA